MIKRKGFFRLAVVALAFGVSGLVTAQELIVSAAASLNNAFTEIGQEFERQNPGTKVTFNFAASGVLLRQIEQGAPVDVFASADQATMDRAIAAGLIEEGTRFDFVENKLVLIVANGVEKPEDLSDLCNPVYQSIAIGTPSSVPAGNYTQQVLQKDGLWEVLEPKFIFGESVRQVLQYVSMKEAEAGFVYSTDAAVNAKDVQVAFVVPTLEPITYPIGLVRNTEHSDLAKAFLTFISGEYAQSVFAQYGFASLEK